MYFIYKIFKIREERIVSNTIVSKNVLKDTKQVEDSHSLIHICSLTGKAQTDPSMICFGRLASATFL